MDFPAFQLLMQRLLTEMGYTPVSSGRKHWKGRTRRGGRDFEVSAQTGLTHGLVIVQIKHYTRPVQRRFVDELRGTMLRLGARHGLLMSTSTFPPGAHEAAAGDGVAPIRLIDGETLLDLCFTHQLGVNRLYQNTKRGLNSAECEEYWELDTALFERLAQTVHSASARQAPSKGQKVCHNGGLPSRDRPETGVPATAHPMAVVPVWRQIKPVNVAGAGGTTETVTVETTTIEIPTTKTNTEATSFLGGDMTWRTHTIAGLGSLWLLSIAPNGVTPDNLALVAVCAALGSLLPDLDAAESKIKHLRIAGIQPFAPIAVSFFRGLGHRGLLHSLLGLLVIAAASLSLIPWLGWQAVCALILGYASHLVTDAMTRSGIPWLYPHKQRYHLLPPQWRFVTGSYAELVLFPFLALLFSLLLLRVILMVVMTPLGAGSV